LNTIPLELKNKRLVAEDICEFILNHYND